jgi:hypothetical protein
VQFFHELQGNFTPGTIETATETRSYAVFLPRQFGHAQDASPYCGFLDLAAPQPQTDSMAHIYLLFEFANDEEKAQQARHKLETWKQAFRLDKKLLYKLERTATEVASTDGDAKPAKADKKPKTKGKGSTKALKEKEDEAVTPAANEDIRLFVRLGFSGHEKLSEERWVQRIPTEEPFRDASPVVVKPGDAKFEATETQFEELA